MRIEAVPERGLRVEGVSLTLGGRTIRALYPYAADPMVDFLADLCVYVVVLAWWATPFEQIVFFWERLREARGT